MPRILEADLERYCLDLLKGEGYQHFPGDSFDPDAVIKGKRHPRHLSA